MILLLLLLLVSFMLNIIHIISITKANIFRTIIMLISMQCVMRRRVILQPLRVLLQLLLLLLFVLNTL